MPTVNVNGVGEVNFPDSMSAGEIKSVLDKKYQTSSTATTPPPAATAASQSLSEWTPTIGDRLKMAADKLGQQQPFKTIGEIPETASKIGQSIVDFAKASVGKNPDHPLPPSPLSSIEVPSGAELTRDTGLPPVVTETASAIDKTVMGLASFVTSPQGAEQMATYGVPVLKLPMAAKWISDMIKGGYLNIVDAVDAFKKGDTQRLRNNIIGATANFEGALGVGGGEVSSLKDYFGKLSDLETVAPPASREAPAPMTTRDAIEQIPAAAPILTGASLYPLPKGAKPEDVKLPLAPATEQAVKATLSEPVPAKVELARTEPKTESHQPEVESQNAPVAESVATPAKAQAGVKPWQMTKAEYHDQFPRTEAPKVQTESELNATLKSEAQALEKSGDITIEKVRGGQNYREKTDAGRKWIASAQSRSFDRLTNAGMSAGIKANEAATIAGEAASHKIAIQEAMRAGETIPPEVLADYPDLAPPKDTESDELSALRKKDLSDDGLTKDEEQRLYELSRKETQSKRAAKTSKMAGQLKEQGVDIPDSFLYPSDGVENHITSWTYDHRNGMMQIRVERHTDATMSGRLITVKAGDVLTDGMDDIKVGTTRYREANPDAALRAGEKSQTPPGASPGTSKLSPAVRQSTPQRLGGQTTPWGFGSQIKSPTETLNKYPNTGAGSPADEYGAIYGPKLTSQQMARFKEQEGQSFPLDSPPGTTTTLKVKPNMLWVETDQPESPGSLMHNVGVAYMHIRSDGTTVLDASKHGRPIDKLAAEKLSDFLHKTSKSDKPAKPASPIEILNTASKVTIKAPKGATMVRVTDKAGKTSVQDLKSVQVQNVFKGADIKKIEAGTIGKDKKFIPMKGEISVGPGAASPGDVPLASQEQQLMEAINSLPKGEHGEPVPRIDLATKAAEAIGEGKKTVSDWWLRTKAGGEQFKRLLLGPPPLEGPFWKTKGDWTANRQVNSGVARELIETGKRLVPNPKDRSAMGKYAESLMFDDPDATLKSWEETSKLSKNKELYRKAQALTDEQKMQVRQAIQYYEAKGKELQDLGLLNKLVEDYAGQHMVDIRKETPEQLNTLRADLVSGKLNTNFKYAMRRLFQTEHDLEQAGYKLKTTDLYDKLANYSLSANNVLADRAAVRQWMSGETPDGKPYFTTGIGRRLIEAHGEKQNDALLVNPKVRPDPKWENPQTGETESISHEYVKIDHPAFRKYQWADTDPETGKQVFVQGDIWAHKSIAGELANSLGRSKLYEVPGVDTATRINAQAKGLKLVGFFHQVKTGSHALFHLTRPFGQPKIDVHAPETYEAMRNGLQLFETRNVEMFSEGLSASPILQKIPGAGPLLQGYQEYLFQDYIPRIKMATYRNALERNTSRYGGELSNQQLKQITATQVNSAFGELNWRLMGINPNFQHALRLSLLAPDFQAAQHGFMAQIFTPKGGEQRMAAAIMIASVYTGTRVINKLMDDDPHWELKRAFSVVHGGREYGIRTIATDAQRAITDAAQYVYHRTSPIASSAIELMTKTSALGKRETGKEALKNVSERALPIPLTPRSDVGFMEGALSSTLGFYEKRQSDISDIHKIAAKWSEKNDPKWSESISQYPESPYQKLRQALEDNDDALAEKEYRELVKKRTPNEIEKAISSQRPFTRSKVLEEKFKASLSGEDKKTYDRAIEQRKTIIKRFHQMNKSVD